MSLNDLSVAQLQQILVLIQQKERLQKELALIESTLFALESSYPQAVPSEPKTNKRNRRKSAPLKVAIVAALEGAGKAGLTADDIAKQTGCKKSQYRGLALHEWKEDQTGQEARARALRHCVKLRS